MNTKNLTLLSIGVTALFSISTTMLPLEGVVIALFALLLPKKHVVYMVIFTTLSLSFVIIPKIGALFLYYMPAYLGMCIFEFLACYFIVKKVFTKRLKGLNL